jgi:hypothetical protein
MLSALRVIPALSQANALPMSMEHRFLGSKVEYRPQTDIGRSLLPFGKFEDEEAVRTRRPKPQRAEGLVVSDVGANIGPYSPSFANLVGSAVVASSNRHRQPGKVRWHESEQEPACQPCDRAPALRQGGTREFCTKREDEAYSGLEGYSDGSRFAKGVRQYRPRWINMSVNEASRR